MTTTSTLMKRRIAVTERKKAELDSLALQVLDAQQEVDQFQSIVDGLTAKLATFQGYLSYAETNRTNALNNLNLVNQVVQNYLDLMNNSSTAFYGIADAGKWSRTLSMQISRVMNKLIYSSEVINRLAALVIRKKALNPLISDELVSVLNTAGTDANNAVALTLVALQSVYASQASNTESEAAAALEYYEAMNVYEFIAGTNAVVIDASTQKPDCLQKLLSDAYKNAVEYYNEMYTACQNISEDLNNAQQSLSEAQISLQSLQLGLAAGNAAALAS
ncbi:MAG TPA: hypothetical protein VFU15_01490 [Bacteroidia bacterium]|nr:hypothetical protein [Bacteroidia bacterium]